MNNSSNTDTDLLMKRNDLLIKMTVYFVAERPYEEHYNSKTEHAVMVI